MAFILTLYRCLVDNYICLLFLQINRNGTLLRGRLAQLLTEGTSPNPRWLVKFDGQNHKDEEIYERSFGKMISANDEEDPNISSGVSPLAGPQARSSKPSGVKPIIERASRRGSAGHGSSRNSSSEGEAPEGEKTSNAKKVVQFNGPEGDGGGSNAGSDNSSTAETSSTRRSARDRVSAREARSRRRQAKIDEELPGGEIVGGVAGGGVAGVAPKRRAPPPPQQPNKKRKNEDGLGEVVKVKLLTGTLYLYRGRHRRAEFIRRV